MRGLLFALGVAWSVPLSDVLPRLAFAPAKYLGEVGPGVHAFGSLQPMSRVRAYQTSVLNPIGGRGSPSETLLFGHLHTDAAGLVAVVESFIAAGVEGKRWAEAAHAELQREGLLAPGAQLRLDTPSRGCAYGLR